MFLEQHCSFVFKHVVATLGVCTVLLGGMAARPLQAQSLPGVEATRGKNQKTPVVRAMVLIPAGEFVMGTREDEAKQLAAKHDVDPSLFLTESPQRQVNLKAYLIDRYPVTNAQFHEFLDATGDKPWKPQQHAKGREHHPVTNVAWRDADRYARWAGLRLPTQRSGKRQLEARTAARIPGGTNGEMRPRAPTI